ncbi:GNAT family N-acetyltransferase [Streptomyces fragilis]|uniref:GNAT family N-acetyltransferase n=1 Tax=Streptomyces fragilis TaxID=67301 RepID=A0ABV2YBB4_9ACTN|nr:GNAT family N-acetyltransferase [Streptomyces fragilis]
MSSAFAHLTARPIAPTDAAGLSALLNAIEAVDVFGEYYSEEDAAEQINAPLLDLGRGTVGLFDGDLMVGYSSAAHQPRAEGVHRVTLSGGVHPDHRRRGLGTGLLAAGIACARTLHALHHPALPLAVAVRNNARNAGALACYRAAGMTLSGSSSHLRRPLDAGVADVPVPEGHTVEAYAAGNDADFHLTSDEAFLESRGGVPMPPERWRELLGWQAFRPDLSFLLREDGSGAAAGMVLVFSWDADTEATGVRDAQILRIGTRPGHRGRGVASALLGHALRAAQDAGFDRVSLDVDAEELPRAHGLFERAGFTVARTEVVHTLEFTGRAQHPTG